MFEHWRRYDSVLDVYRYSDLEQLMANIREALIQPVLDWEQALDARNALQARAEALDDKSA